MMRPARKSAVATNVSSKPLPLRNCTVRVVRKTESIPVSSTPVTLAKVNSSASQSNWRNSSTPVTEERKFRGPLKKRPITELASASPAKSSPNINTIRRDATNTIRRDTTNTIRRDAANKSVTKTPVTQLVAGRARRAIKPNPKYTSEDMVTPRILKTVTSSGTKTEGEKEHFDDTIDDFFSRDSSEDGDVYLDDLIGKAFNDSDKEYTDNDSMILENSKSNRSSSTGARKRGRPRREPIDSPVDSNASVASPKPATITTAKNESMSKANVRQAVGAQKRQAEKDSTELHVTRKRFVFSADGQKIKTLSEYDNKASTRSNTTLTSVAAKSTTNNVTTPINKTTSYRLKEILDEALGSEVDELEDDIVREINQIQKGKDSREQQENISVDTEKKKLTESKVKLITKKTPPVLRTRMQLEQHVKNKTQNIHGKDNVNTNANSETKVANNDKNLNENNMPTFTIVNINDIISKKGDALISKSSISSVDNINSNKTQTTNGRQDNLQQRVLKKTTGPTILNHQLANRQLAVKANTVAKQAPRILNAIVSKKTQPIKPTTQNPDDSAESFTLSLDEDEETEDEINKTFGSIGTDLSLTEADNSADERRTRSTASGVRPVGKKRIQPLRLQAAEKRAAELKRTSTPDSGKEQSSISARLPPEKVEITRQGNKIVKKITCLENWYVITRKNQIVPPQAVRNQFDMPLIELANAATTIQLPNDQWSSKVTLYELPAAQLAKGTYTTYTGSLTEYNISEEDRAKYQPSCVMFRRAVSQKEKSRLPYDRAVIFKNNTFYTNIEGKNVRLIAAPHVIDTQEQVEIMLNIMDTLSLQCAHVETTGSI